MNTENKESLNPSELGNNIKTDVSTRTFLFKGWKDGRLIEETIKANDRESAIAKIENKYPDYSFPLSQELF
jgi:hypothetical protein